MKLIIDIDDKTYDRIKRIDKIHGIAPLNEYEIAIANGTLLEEELENIKAEILEHHCIKCYGTCETYCPYSDCIEPKDVIEDLKIIDNHIEELKGENNE